jgi:nucleotide-binding universal stress UspA family protein
VPPGRRGGSSLFKRILVATDFSPGAERAWKVATELAALCHAELLLLHVPMESAREPGRLPADSQRFHQEEVRRATGELEARTTAAAAHGVRALPLLEPGEPAETVARTAARRRVDLIVVGAHPRPTGDGLLVGSVGQRVVRLADCPVLTVKAAA